MSAIQSVKHAAATSVGCRGSNTTVLTGCFGAGCFGAGGFAVVVFACFRAIPLQLHFQILRHDDPTSSRRARGHSAPAADALTRLEPADTWLRVREGFLTPRSRATRERRLRRAT